MTRQGWLLWIWLVGFIACFLAVLLLWPLGDERPENLPSHIGVVATVYSPYLLPIITFWLAKHDEIPNSPRTPFLIALVISLLFNIVVIAIIASVHFQLPGIDVAQNTIALTSKIAAALSFLIAPAIGFFFGKTS